jgi:hypothetical protein
MKKGFTIIECMIALGIIGLVGALLIELFFSNKLSSSNHPINYNKNNNLIAENPTGNISENKDCLQMNSNVFEIKEEHHGDYNIVIVKEATIISYKEYVFLVGSNWVTKVR